MLERFPLRAAEHGFKLIDMVHHIVFLFRSIRQLLIQNDRRMSVQCNSQKVLSGWEYSGGIDSVDRKVRNADIAAGTA